MAESHALQDLIIEEAGRPFRDQGYTRALFNFSLDFNPRHLSLH